MKIGDMVDYDNEIRQITRIFNNEKEKPVIEWVSEKTMGVVLPSIWQEWKDGVDPKLRRVNDDCACEPKPRSRQLELRERCY